MEKMETYQEVTNETTVNVPSGDEVPVLNFDFFLNNPLVEIKVTPYSPDGEQSDLKIIVKHNGCAYYLNVSYGKVPETCTKKTTGYKLSDLLDKSLVNHLLHFWKGNPVDPNNSVK